MSWRTILRFVGNSPATANANRAIRYTYSYRYLYPNPDFYANPDAAKPLLDRHQTLMWEVGELLAQWEMLQQETDHFSDLQNS